MGPDARDLRDSGMNAAVAPSVAAVRDDKSNERLELGQDGDVAFLVYKKAAGALTIVHTEVPPALRGRHLGDVLVQAALAMARRDGLRVVAVCPFARAYLKKHPITG